MFKVNTRMIAKEKVQRNSNSRRRVFVGSGADSLK